MKSKALLFFIAIIAAIFAPSVKTIAQTIIGDTMLCPAATYGAAGELRKLILGDTLANGDRVNPNRVYKVERGETYWMDARGIYNYNLSIVADDEDPANPSAPAIFAPWVLEDGSSAGDWIDHRNGNLTLKNIYFMYWRSTDKKQVGWSVPVSSSADNARIKITGCIFDGASGNAITYSGRFCKVYIQDCYFKNGQHPTSYFGGGAIHSNASPVDTVVIVNNTAFCNTGYFALIYSFPDVTTGNYKRVEHNTVILNAVNVFYDFTGINTMIKNNLVYSGNAMGASKSQAEEGWFDRDQQAPGIVSVDSLNQAMLDTGFTEGIRSYVVEGNVYYWPQAVKDYWADPLDSVLLSPTWMNPRSVGIFADNTTWPGFTEANNVEADPGFNSEVTDQVPMFVDYATRNRRQTQTDYLYVYNPHNNISRVEWPLTENFAYTADLKGTDGFPVGDLNWFPEAKEQWEQQIGVEEEPNGSVPSTFSLAQNYPNPFNPSTVIRYSIPQAAFVTLKVYNTLGQEVASLVNAEQAAKTYEVSFDASKLSSGIYFYTVKAGNFVSTKKMMLIK